MSFIPTNDEVYDLELYKRKPNSKYEWEDVPALTFSGRPASQIEKKNYRVQKGVNGNSDSVFIKATNLPSEVQVGDHILFDDKVWVVKSIGHYYDQARFINTRCLSKEQILERCPKGLNLQ